MDEEQKQAIKELKHFTNMTVFWKEKEYTSHEIDNCINIILHLIDKQQKEIKEIPISDDYISKDKIKEKISILEKLQKEFLNNNEIEIKIIAYKELLGE